MGVAPRGHAAPICRYRHGVARFFRGLTEVFESCPQTADTDDEAAPEPGEHVTVLWILEKRPKIAHGKPSSGALLGPSRANPAVVSPVRVLGNGSPITTIRKELASERARRAQVASRDVPPCVEPGFRKPPRIECLPERR
jgi:hypothetical protein